MAWAGSMNTPGPFNFRGCDLTAEWLPATEYVRVQFPATAPIPLSRAPACAAESPKLRLPGAAPGRLANGVVADKQCTCPASRVMWERYPPTPPAFARCDAAGEGCPQKLVGEGGLR